MPTNFNSKADRTLMNAAAVLYYQHDYRQKEIADRLGIPASKVTGLLAEARRLGVVNIEIHLAKEEDLSANLLTLFHKDIKSPQAIVVPLLSKIGDEEMVQDAIGIAAARYFESLLGKVEDEEIDQSAVDMAVARYFKLLVSKMSSEEVIQDKVGYVAAQHFESLAKSGFSIGIDGGKAISSLVEALQPATARNLRIYPIAGGPADDPLTSVQALIGRFLGKYTARSLSPHFLPAPKVDSNDELIYGPQTKRILEEAKDADIFLLGIGRIPPKSVQEPLQGRNLTIDTLINYFNIDVEKLRSQNIVGVVGYSAIDNDGNFVPSEFDLKVYKIDGDDLKKASRKENKQVIIIGTGQEKAPAIRAALKGGVCNCIITDSNTAEAVVDLN